MIKRIIWFIVILFLSFSIFTNCFLFLRLYIVKDLNVKGSSMITSTTNKKYEDDEKKNEIDLMKSNPIDNFINKQELVDISTPSMTTAEIFYANLWEAEMEHAYKVLLEKGHPSIKNNIIESQNRFKNFADNEMELAGAVYRSDAFGDEFGQHDEVIHYGSEASAIRFKELGELYKKRSIELIEYLDYTGIEYQFLFNEANLNTEDLQLFK